MNEQYHGSSIVNEDLSKEQKLSSKSVVLVHSRYFHIELQAGRLNIVHIEAELVPKCAWWLLRQYTLPPRYERSSLFSSLIMDETGASLACTPLAAETLRTLISPQSCTISPQKWRALVINIADSAFEFPGTVYFLANLLSDEGLSILHISTFESEVFLIQEFDVEKACTILQNVVKSGRIEKFLDNPLIDSTDSNGGRGGGDYVDDSSSVGESSTTRSDTDFTTQVVSEQESAAVGGLKPVTDNTFTPPRTTSRLEEDETIDLDVSWITPSVAVNTDQEANVNITKAPISSLKNNVVLKEGFYLTVLPNYVRLAKLTDGIDVSEFASILTKTLLFDERFNLYERKLHHIEENNHEDIYIDTGHGLVEIQTEELHPFMWGMWQFDNEMTFLLQESDLSLFPKNSLITSPQRWRIIKLAGRPIGFDECGVVSAMSRIETNIPTLNISTTTTNCTLVPHELLESTVNSLSKALNCPIQKS